jgi:hypothetical protein
MSACFRTLLLISRVLFASVSLAGNLGPEGGCIRPPCFLILRLRGGVSESRQVGAKDSAGQLGESIENSIAQRGWFEVHRHEGQQERRLRKRREQWEEKVHGRQRAGDSEDGGEEDELSSEGKLSSDRPDAYVKPEPPVETDFKETGLPDWLDPIYDDEDSDEYQEPEVEDSVGGFTDDVAHFDYDGEKNKYSIKYVYKQNVLHRTNKPALSQLRCECPRSNDNCTRSQVESRTWPGACARSSQRVDVFRDGGNRTYLGLQRTQLW